MVKKLGNFEMVFVIEPIKLYTNKPTNFPVRKLITPNS